MLTLNVSIWVCKVTSRFGWLQMGGVEFTSSPFGNNCKKNFLVVFVHPSPFQLQCFVSPWLPQFSTLSCRTESYRPFSCFVVQHCLLHQHIWCHFFICIVCFVFFACIFHCIICFAFVSRSFLCLRPDNEKFRRDRAISFRAKSS